MDNILSHTLSYARLFKMFGQTFAILKIDATKCLY
jgi:hypothetical protein